MKCPRCKKNQVESWNKDIGICESCLAMQKIKQGTINDLKIENEIYGAFR